jgi:hypothetical protein
MLKPVTRLSDYLIPSLNQRADFVFNKSRHMGLRKNQRKDGRGNTISKSKMILRRLGGGDEAYYRYLEEADNDANKNSALI